MTPSRIMIVDDETLVVRDLEVRLLNLGYGITGIAASGGDAISLAIETRPDLILMDINLKGDIDGIQTAAEIGKKFSVPIIYLTAFTDEKTLARAKLTEPYGYIVKPFTERELQANIEMALYKHGVEFHLRKVQRWIAGSVDQVIDAVIVADENGCISYLNEAAAAITEWPQSDALGQDLMAVLRLLDGRTGDLIIINNALAERGIVIALDHETSLATRNGERINVDCTVTAVHDEQGKPQGTISILRDVSGQMRGALTALNTEITAVLARPHAMSQMLQACTGAIAHRLKGVAQIWTIDSSGELLELRGSAGSDRSRHSDETSVSIDHSHIGNIVRRRKSQVINDLFNKLHIDLPAWAQDDGIVSFGGFPLLVDDRPVGVLMFYSPMELHEHVRFALNSVASAVAVGVERKVAEATVREREKDVLRIADDEQRRIGQDLHDSVQQDLAGVGMLAHTLLGRLAKPAGATVSLEAQQLDMLIRKLVDGITRAQREVQAISRGLIPVRLDSEGLMDALRTLAVRTNELEGIISRFKCEQKVEVVDSVTATHLYRIAQEAVTNAIKHACAEHIRIALLVDDDQFVMQISDDGLGFDPNAKHRGGMGLATMRFRASMIGAQLTVRALDTGGTMISCRFSGTLES